MRSESYIIMGRSVLIGQKMGESYVDVPHPKDLIVQIPNARSCIQLLLYHSNVLSKMINEIQKTGTELCEKARTPGSIDADL
eukprot:4253972-Ditylum_brightwellii.AAC.1